MAATVTTLDHAIAREERMVGLPTDRPLTDAAISHRHIRVALLLCACAFVAVWASLAAEREVRALAIALAVFMALYAAEKDRHLRRLATLHDETVEISLVVADELLFSGALTRDVELLDLRRGFGRTAGRLASGLAEVLPVDCARVRMVGPSGEIPVAAELELAPQRPVPGDAAIASDALHAGGPVHAKLDDGRGILVVPMRRGKDVVGLLEAVAPGGVRFTAADAALVDAYARGAIAALMSPPVSS